MKSVFTFALCLGFLWSFSAPALAQKPTAPVHEKTAEGLLEIAIERLNTTSEVKKLTPLAQEIQKFIANPMNKAALEGEAGKQLQSIQIKLANYFSLTAKFNECINDKNNKLRLEKRMLETFLRSPDKTKCVGPAMELVKSQSTFEDIVKKLKKEYGAGIPNSATKWSWDTAVAMRTDIINQGYKDALKTYLDLNHRYTLSKGGNDKRPMKTIVCDLFENNVCAPGSTGMHRLDSYTTDELEKFGTKYQAQLNKHVKPMSTEDVRKKLNGHFDAIEKAYFKVPRQPTTHHLMEGQGYSESDHQKYKDKGGAHAWVQDQLAENVKKQAVHDQKVKEYEAWYNSYLSSMTKYPSGSLIFTSAISKYFAAPMQYHDETQMVNFERIPNATVVDGAIVEAKAQLKKFGHFLSEKDYTKVYMTKHVLTTDEVKKQIKELVKYAPAAASQVLVNNPAYAPFMCDAINCVHAEKVQEDEDAENADRNMMIWGGVIVAGALVTGGASIALVAVAPSIAAVAAATSTGFLVGGTILGASSGVYYANRADEINQDYTKLKAAFIGTGAKDLDAWRVMSKQLDELEEAKFNMYMAVGFTALDVGTFGAMVKGMSNVARMKAVQDAVTMMNVSKWNPVRNSRMISIIKNVGEEEASRLFTVLSQYGKDAKYIDDFLLKATKLSKPELAKLIKSMTDALDTDGAAQAIAVLDKFYTSGKITAVASKEVKVVPKVEKVAEGFRKPATKATEGSLVSEHTLATRFTSLDGGEKEKLVDLLKQQKPELSKKIVSAIEQNQIYPDILLSKIQGLKNPSKEEIAKIFETELLAKKQDQAIKWIDTPIPPKEVKKFDQRWADLQTQSQSTSWNDMRKQKQYADQVAKIEEARLPFTGPNVKYNQEEQLANANWRKANNSVNEWVKRGKDLDLEKLKELNATLGKGLDLNNEEAGVIRKGVIRADQDKYLAPEKIDENLQKFLKWYQENEKTMPAPQLAAESYQKLLSIHPFGDGNKRTSRLVMDWILQKNGYPPALMKSDESFLSLFQSSTMADKTKALENVTKSIERSFETLGGVTNPVRKVETTEVNSLRTQSMSYDGNNEKLLLRDPSSTISDPTYKTKANEAVKYFDQWFWKNTASSTSDDFTSMTQEMHKISAYKGAEVERGVIRTETEYGYKNVRSTAATYTQKVLKDFKLGEVPDGKIKIEGIPEDALPYNVKQGKVHYYPKGADVEKIYFKRGNEILNDLKAQMKNGVPKEQIYESIGKYYHVMVNARPFENVNNSVFMNQVNYLLRVNGHTGIIQGEWDHILMRINSDQASAVWKKILSGEVKSSKDLIGKEIH